MVKARIINYKISFYILLGLNIIVLSFIFTPITNYLYAILEVEAKTKKADAIILLSSANYTENIFERNTYQRMIHASHLYNQGYAEKIIICGGVLKKGMPSIAEIMKSFLVEIGISKTDIITENNSQNTYENIKNAMTILKKQNVTNSLLVTSSYHMYRSLAICKKLGVNVYPAPVPCYEKSVFHTTLRTRFVLEILREYCAIIYFKIRGWI